MIRTAILGSIIVVIVWLGYWLYTNNPPDSSIPKVNDKKEEPMKVPAMTIDPKKTYRATVQTSKGTMVIVLSPAETPVTVNNFVTLAKKKFYDGTVFHRVISGFMIQGGDPKGNGTGGPGYQFDDEPVTRSYTRGTIAMANSGPNTNGSQFFIMHKDYGLPKKYVIFGAIDPSDTESLKTLDAIASVSVTDNGMGETSKPQEKITIDSVAIEEK